MQKSKIGEIIFLIFPRENNWIKYYPFSWGLKREGGLGIANEAQYLCTKYTDLIHDSFIKSKYNIRNRFG